jgi:hypothetical protein
VNKVQKFQKYIQNLGYDNEFVYSYQTKVAKIDFINNTLYRLGYWSQTTSKHINYAADRLGLKVMNMEG